MSLSLFLSIIYVCLFFHTFIKFSSLYLFANIFFFVSFFCRVILRKKRLLRQNISIIIKTDNLMNKNSRKMIKKLLLPLLACFEAKTLRRLENFLDIRLDKANMIYFLLYRITPSSWLKNLYEFVAIATMCLAHDVINFNNFFCDKIIFKWILNNFLECRFYFFQGKFILVNILVPTKLNKNFNLFHSPLSKALE